MAIIFDGSFKGLEERSMKRLAEKGFSTSPGSIARLFNSIINSELTNLYDIITQHHNQAFVSTASGIYLNSIGMLVNCERNEDEDDNSYRKRIINQIQLTSSSNELAIRLTALSVPGVKDIYLKNFSQGAGTFTVVVMSERYITSEELLINVYNALKEQVAYGINFSVERPINYYISMTIDIIFRESTDEIKRKDIKMFVKENIYKYINSMSLGENLIINELTQRIMEVSEEIVTYNCTEFKINNNPTMYINQDCKWTGRFVILPQPDAINIK